MAVDGDLPGRVASLFVAAAAGEPMRAVESVEAVAGRGLVGDRYFLGTGYYSARPGPDRELTLVELEALEALEREHGIALAPPEARRNVVTTGVALNDLVGRDFRVGGVVARGLRLCEPCAYLAGLTGKQVVAPLVHRGGLRAQILAGGAIRTGDDVRPA